MIKSVMVTGAGRGIGRDIALGLAESGYKVFGCARSLDQLEQTRELSKGKIEIAAVDVTDMHRMEEWISNCLSKTEFTPWGLVTAAGIQGPIGPFIENSWSAWKQVMDVNVYGSALAIRFFAKHLISKNFPGRIAMLSGGGATKPIPNFSSYCASKAAVVRLCETVALELKPHHITLNALAPGAIFSEITKETISAGPEIAGKEAYESALKISQGGGQTTEKAVNLTRYLLSEESAPITGRLISAVWDSWSTLHSQFERFEKTDVFTLRRIVPEDRFL